VIDDGDLEGAKRLSGVGPAPGAFEVEEDEEKLTFRMNPCGSGQRLWRMGRYRERGSGLTTPPTTGATGARAFPSAAPTAPS
jgi:hypothetical protein